MRILLVVGCLGLGGCATAQSFTTPDGKPGYVVSCGGELQTIAACHEKAREMCGGDYTEINRSVTTRFISDDMGSTENRTLEIACAT